MARADFALPRAGVITGRIVDEFGDPVAGSRVMVMRYQSFQGTRRLAPAGQGDQTDDTGAFRVYGLPPGDYYVSATLQSGMFMADDSNDRTSYAPTYYPGTGNVAAAQRVTVARGPQSRQSDREHGSARSLSKPPFQGSSPDATRCRMRSRSSRAWSPAS